MSLVDVKPAVCACRGCPICGQSFSGVVDAVAAGIHVILPPAFAACGNAAVVHIEGIAFHGDGVVVEAVGAFRVVGIELCRVAEVAVSHDDAVVHAEVVLALQPLVDGIEDGLGSLSLAVPEYEIECSGVDFMRYLAEYSLGIRIQSRVQGLVKMLAVVYGEVAVIVAVGELLAATGGQGGGKQQG